MYPFAIDPVYLLLGGIAATLTVALALVIRPRGMRRPGPAFDAASDAQVAFLFRDGHLIDASNAAQELVDIAMTFDEVAQRFAQRFPDLQDWSGKASGPTRIPSHLDNDGGYFEATQRGQMLSLVLKDVDTSALDRHQWLNATQKAEELRDVVDRAPVAIWTVDGAGAVISGNAAFGKLAEMTGDAMPFADAFADTTRPKDTRRLSLDNPATGKTHWYDVTNQPMGQGHTTYYAINADVAVNAEAAQRNFVQTLTKTFAQLSIGLAIFDRKRQLALFNPALIDLTLLPADFLSARPSLNAFFDQLRDRQIMPEPRNYKTWRDQLSDMIAAAQDGQYCETWTLPSGLTYRISGKPHPDGAVAFLFEDISAEISLTRRFRAELELSQSALDALDTAIAVFSRTGSLTFANAQFRSLWKCNPDESFIEMSILDMSRIWQTACNPSPVWGDLRDFITSSEERTEWADEVTHMQDGRIRIDAGPLSGGSTLVQFTLLPPASGLDTPTPKIAQVTPEKA